MRVATRRMRAILRAARPLLDPEWVRSLRAELGWLGGALGPVRDLDVLRRSPAGGCASARRRRRARVPRCFCARSRPSTRPTARRFWPRSASRASSR